MPVVCGIGAIFANGRRRPFRSAPTNHSIERVSAGLGREETTCVHRDAQETPPTPRSERTNPCTSTIILSGGDARECRSSPHATARTREEARTDGSRPRSSPRRPLDRVPPLGARQAREAARTGDDRVCAQADACVRPLTRVSRRRWRAAEEALRELAADGLLEPAPR